MSARSRREHGDGPGANGPGASPSWPRAVIEQVQALAHRADHVQRRHRWLAIPAAVVRKYSDDRGGHWASLIAFYGFFSLFPLLLVFVTVLGFVIRDDPELQRRVIGSALAQFPIIGAQIERNIGALRGSGWALAIGLAGATWSGMRVIAAIQGAMDELWNVPRRDRPGFIRTRVEALLALAVLGTATLGATALASLGTSGGWLSIPLRGLAVGGTLAVMTGVLVLVFRLLTEADVSWRDVLPGAIVGALAWGALLVAGAWIVDRQLRNATEVYGFFAIVIGLLGWMALAATVLLYAAELNVVLKRRLWPRSVLEQSELTGPDERVLAAEATEEAARDDETVEVRFGQGSAEGPVEPSAPDDRRSRDRI